ncbi:antibiotic biosynthesis monooxygenase [Bradyrhizobium sp. Pear77]|uniref:putative quinol monooxygenase n=1 Tax=Bradyrhizobium altum TaxID=1571202 RepID=UPI001E6090AA|nr:putative quinol monooxygenase [Bradyrhizobium altum]MCC8959395.1 antibiotic biosynthesis monooxygenase [Bradyrhizobium altum]
MPKAPRMPCVRVAEIKIDPAHRDAYAAALREQIETAVRVEPGALALHAASDKNDPARIIVFEIYADVDAYETHLETPHFRTYKAATAHMVTSLTLIEAFPIALAAKAM